MNCPKCEEGKLSKIRFTLDKSQAYLCDICGNYWYVWEAVNLFTGHVLDDNAKEKSVPEIYEFISKEDKDQQEIEDERERELYERY